MAFTYTVLTKLPLGAGKMLVFGTYDADSVDTGDIVTGCSEIEAVSIGFGTVADGATIDHTTAAGTITLASITSSDTGSFQAICLP